MFWIGIFSVELRWLARSVSSFCDFQKMTFRDSTAILSYLTRENLVFLNILIKEY